MSLHAQSKYQVPEETARVAQAVFPKGNIYVQWYDAFGALFKDEEFAALFAHDGQPGLPPVQRCLVLLMQFAEGLSDRQAADAVRSRIDWKYLLCLELTDPGFPYSVLSEFRTRLLNGKMEQGLFEKLLDHFRDQELLKHRGRQRTDSTHVLATIHTLNRVELVGETLRHALNVLAVAVPDWLLARSHPDWIDRYGERVSDYRLPKHGSERQAYVETVGADGLALLTAIWQSDDIPGLRNLPAIQTMWKVWIQNYTGQEDGRLRWRKDQERPPASNSVRSPYDCEARFSKKRSTSWVGYKVHVTETCDEDAPRLITPIETTVATTPDNSMVPPIHGALQAKDCLPSAHIVDGGYGDASLLVTSQDDYAVDLIGPAGEDTAWQSRQGNGFASQDFTINWETK